MDIKREPALLYIGLLAPFAQLLTLFFTDLSLGWHTVLMAAIPAVAGLLTAWAVRAESLVPALTGLAQAVIACVIAFGFVMTTDQQSALMAFIGLALSVVVRDRVVAPVAERATV